MKALRRSTLVGVLCAVIGGCSGSSTGTNGSTPPNVVGSWHATKFEFVSTANTSTRTDFVSTDQTITATLTATNVTITSQGTAVLTGTYTETATMLTFNGTDSGGHPETLAFALALNGNTLSLTGAATTHNFGSGEVSSTLNMTYTKL